MSAGAGSPLHSVGCACHVRLCLPTATLPSLAPLQPAEAPLCCTEWDRSSGSPGLCFQVEQGEADVGLPRARDAGGAGGHIAGAGDL